MSDRDRDRGDDDGSNTGCYAPTARPTLSEAAFEAVRPTRGQLADLAVCRESAKAFAVLLEHFLPPGEQKERCLRELLELLKRVEDTLTRHADGRPRA